MAREGGRQIEPGIVARVAQGLRYAVTGQRPQDWFGPLEPLPPVAPPSVRGRQFDFQSGYNLNTQPRVLEQVSFAQMRALAENYDVLRLVIENRKKKMARCHWSIKPRSATGRADDPRIEKMTTMLRRPDGVHTWSVWLKGLLDDHLVIDAATIWPSRSLGGDLLALELVDGATIKPILDEKGRRPRAPNPAYQQVLKGLPAVNYRADELLYLPGNIRPYKVYGYSPVEWIITTVNLALRRQLHKLEFYTEGTVPDAISGVPDTWSPDQIKEFQDYFDMLLSGQTGARRRVRFVPSAMSKSFVQTKEAALKDDMDEWLARLCSYAYDATPQWAVKEMNRASAGTAKDQDDEGLEPTQQFVKEAMDEVLALAGCPDLEFAWERRHDVDPLVQAQVDKIHLETGVKVINEVRAGQGLEARPDGNTPLLMTGSGAVRLEDVLEPPPVPTPLQQADDPPLGDLVGGDGKGGTGDGDEGAGRKPPPGEKPDQRGKGARAPLAKAAGGRLTIRRDRPILHFAEGQLTHQLVAFLAEEGHATADRAAAAMPKLAKAAGDPGEPGAPAEGGAVAQAGAEGAAVDAAIESVVDAALDIAAWRNAVAQMVTVLKTLTTDGADQAITGVALSSGTRSAAAPGTAGASVKSATNLANARGVSWAEAHGADLVAGLSNTTRDALRRLIVQAEKEGWSVDRLKRAIIEDYAFSPTRARLIAKTELATADHMGNLIGWRAANETMGAGLRKVWVLGPNEVHCPACLANADAGPLDLDEPFPSGDIAPTAHPHCDCDLEGLPPDMEAPIQKGWKVGGDSAF
ncbi:phage portal protein [Nitrospirillum amazonense]|uniref:phage portal protein n=1 Tax=Nitrospirillum amazonense TaxID=28077 RepID=UPI002412B4E3|nr:phage portal protein [Nitrospirillum amazonense]MDG3442462.1 phage portal protein [Nitrospirillum amazonense]